MNLYSSSNFQKAIFLVLFLGLFLTSTVKADGSRPFSEPLAGDNFMIFLENLTAVTNIFQLQDQGLTKGKTKIEPWASSYWPIHQGLLANRYADPSFPKSKVFVENYTYFASRPPEALLAAGQMNQLSPAEKYDLLVGDSNWTLTKAMWQKGLGDLATDGSVQTWTGICHGWSGAVHMGLKQPQNAVAATDVTGRYSIVFYPSDIEAYLSFLWSDSSPPSIQAGQRCKQAVIAKDPYNRPLDPACLDSNAMTWHLAITNRVGLYGISFVMDADAAAQVWNYPVSSYDYSYFNPRTFESTHNLKQAIAPIQYVLTDKFTPYRSPKAKYLVGIVMDVFHPALIAPRTGSPKGNTMHSETYAYDLELDANYNIVGGEWYSHDHPDFLWTFHAGDKAQNREDLAINEVWDARTALPEVYAEQAIKASQRGKILSRITEALQTQSLKSVVTNQIQ